MAIYPFQQDSNQVFYQKIQQKYVWIEWFNENNLKTYDMQGSLIDGSWNLTNDNSVRRSCGLKFIMLDDRMIPTRGSIVWFNQKFRLHLGIKNILTDKIEWSDKGMFLINKPTLNLNNQGRTIDLEGLDFACKCNGILGGQLKVKTKILANTPLNNALRSTIGLAGFTKFNIEENNFIVPYDIEKEADANIWDLVEELINLYMGYEAYFNDDEYFVFQKIKDRKTDIVEWTFDNTKLNIDYRNEPSLENVKNEVIVYGAQLPSGLQITSTRQNTDENNPFSIPNIGAISLVCPQNDKIYTQEQADMKAEYLLQLHSNMAEKIGITTIPILKLDVNKVVEFTDSSSNSIGITGKYLVDRISCGVKFDSTMQIELHKLYY
jgi:hypothetical protein